MEELHHWLCHLPDHEKTPLIAYVDDTNIVGQPAVIVATHRLLADSLLTVGISLNSSKQGIVAADPHNSNGALTTLRHIYPASSLCTSARILGCPIAAADSHLNAAMAGYISSTVQPLLGGVQRIARMEPQLGAYLLRTHVLAKIDFAAFHVGDTVDRQHWVQIDRLISPTLSLITGLKVLDDLAPPPQHHDADPLLLETLPQAWSRELALPYKYGGGRFTRYQEAGPLMAKTFYSQRYADIRTIDPNAPRPNPQDRNRLAKHFTAEAAAILKAAERIPYWDIAFPGQANCKLPGVPVYLHDRVKRNQTQPFISDIWMTIPWVSRERLHKAAWHAQMHILYGNSPPIATREAECANARGRYAVRHNAVQRGLYYLAKDLRLKPVWEDPVINHQGIPDDQAESRKRGDITFTTATSKLTIDIQVVGSTGRTLQDAAARIRAAEGVKRRKYEPVFANTATKFKPFVIGSDGVYGAEALTVLQELRKMARERAQEAEADGAANDHIDSFTVSSTFRTAARDLRVTVAASLAKGNILLRDKYQQRHPSSTIIGGIRAQVPPPGSAPPSGAGSGSHLMQYHSSRGRGRPWSRGGGRSASLPPNSAPTGTGRG
jgi:hypothetical protein